MKTALLCPVVLVLLLSCQPSKPQILQFFYQVNEVWNPQTKEWKESLAVHVQAQNEDSLEDLDHLNLIHDQDRLWWQVKKDTWVRQDRNGENWVGTNNLEPYQGTVLPRGTWRVQLVARSGEAAETRFSLPPLPEDAPPKPRLSLTQKGDELFLEGFPPSYLIWVYGDRDALLAVKKQLGPRFKLSELLPDPQQRTQARAVYFYSYLPRDGTGLRAGPYVLPVSR